MRTYPPLTLRCRVTRFSTILPLQYSQISPCQKFVVSIVLFWLILINRDDTDFTALRETADNANCAAIQRFTKHSGAYFGLSIRFQPLQKLAGRDNWNGAKLFEFKQVVVPAYNEFNFARNGGFKKFVV